MDDERQLTASENRVHQPIRTYRVPMNKTESSDGRGNHVTWSAEVRSAASLLLFIHLFAVIVAVTTYTQPSLLQRRLHELCDLYVRNLHLSAYPVTYPFARFHLTHANPTDVDFSCEMTIDSAGPDAAPIVIPPPGLQPLVRYRRYQALANATGTLAEDALDDGAAGILPRAIGGSILKRRDAAQGEFRVRAHYLPEIDDMATVESGDRAPLENYSNTYEAQVFVSGDKVEILRRSSTLEVAPAEGNAQPTNTPPTSSPPNTPPPQNR